MSATVIFDLQRAIYAACVTAFEGGDGWNVSDGPAANLEGGDWLEVGVGDPRPTTAGQAADSSIDWSNATLRSREEKGSVNLVLSSWWNQADVGTVRDRLQAALAIISGLIVTDPTWSVPGVIQTGISTLNHTIYTDGSAELLVVIGFDAFLDD